METHRSKGKNVFKGAVIHSKNAFKRAICIFPFYRKIYIRDTASKRSFPFCEMIAEIHPIKKTT